MRIQYFSDIHLEFGEFELPATNADVIVAAGDIGVGTDGVNWLKNAGKPVIYIAGNHEFYLGEYFATQKALAVAAAGSHVHFLEHSEVEVGNVRFLGATLWTDFDSGNPSLMQEAQHGMNDYVQIQFEGGELRPRHTLAFNSETRRWLSACLAKPFEGKTVVVTHHAPSFNSWQTERDSFYKHAYCNDLSELMEDSDIDLWIHGHIHYVSNYVHKSVRVVCNPRGYHGYQNIAGFDPAKVIQI